MSLATKSCRIATAGALLSTHTHVCKLHFKVNRHMMKEEQAPVAALAEAEPNTTAGEEGEGAEASDGQVSGQFLIFLPNVVQCSLSTSFFYCSFSKTFTHVDGNVKRRFMNIKSFDTK